MKILIAADMEGITGVTAWDQVTPGKPDYPRFCRLMTEDINAAVRGAFEAGAEEVYLTDGHNTGSNVLIDVLDPRVRLNCGSPSPLAMVQGVQNVDGVIFVGYHARAGSPNGILDHTWSSMTVANVWLNETLMGEIGMNAAVAGHYDVPVIMISGDQTACAQAVEILGEIEIAVVKHATGRYSAECMPPKTSQELIQQAAFKAVNGLAKGKNGTPLVLSEPVLVSIEFFGSDMADRAMTFPGSERRGTMVSVTMPDMISANQAFRVLVALAKGG